ncbi:WYL domain-containing protein [Kribbella antiqua]|uniref:WYL domain-containing protein n=1 Tax=Kribbella antiqua TaxID=2512217 RepID=UPI00104A7BD6
MAAQLRRCCWPTTTLSWGRVGPAHGGRWIILTTVAVVCRVNGLLFDCRARPGTLSARTSERYRLVDTARRWYLVAWDIDRDWRTFRADRMSRAGTDGSPVNPARTVQPGHRGSSRPAFDPRSVASPLRPPRSGGGGAGDGPADRGCGGAAQRQRLPIAPRLAVRRAPGGLGRDARLRLRGTG